MRDFSYHRAASADEARREAGAAGALLLAGGTTLLDLAKCGVAEPDKVVDITHLKGLDAISVNAEGAIIGALAKMSRVAEDAGIKTQFPAVSEALWQAASAQIRNMASMGGNLMQRTRCAYFRDPAAFPACNKRNPGSGCSAIGGVNRGHAVLGVSESCIATYPGDLAAALVGLRCRGPSGRTPDRGGGFLPPARRHARPGTCDRAGRADHRDQPFLPRPRPGAPLI